MGVNQSRSPLFCFDYAIYIGDIDKISSESPSKVYNRIMEYKFNSANQMNAVGLILYEKAINNPELSLKCAQVMKLLETEEVKHEGERLLFHIAFSQSFLGLVETLIDSYDENNTTDFYIHRGRLIGRFIGHLYITDFFPLNPIVEIFQVAKNKYSPKTRFFTDSILEVITDKMTSEGYPLSTFNLLIENYRAKEKLTSEDGPEDAFMEKFDKFLRNLKTTRRYQPFKYFHCFEGLATKFIEVEMRVLLDEAYENIDFLSVYRDTALKFHSYHPDSVKSKLNTELEIFIDRFEVIQDVGGEENMTKLNNLGRIVVEFYNAGLIDDAVLKKFLDMAKSPRLNPAVFMACYLDVLAKFDGAEDRIYFEYLKKLSIEATFLKPNIPVIDEFLRFKEGAGAKKAASNGFVLFPDFHKFASTHSSTIKNPKESPPFSCTNQPSCNFAGSRAMKLLLSHSGHKFFTPERLEVCAKMTKSWLKISRIGGSSEQFLSEFKLFQPYLRGDVKPDVKFENFVELTVACYKEGLIECRVITTIIDDLMQRLKSKNEKYRMELMDIYIQAFRKISNYFVLENLISWEVNSEFIYSCELDKIRFDLKAFSKFMESFLKNAKPMNKHMQELLKIKIPNDRIAFRQISKCLIDLIGRNINQHERILELYLMILNVYNEKLDTNLLQVEFETVLYEEFGRGISVSINSINRKFNDPKGYLKVVHTLCKKGQISQLGLANVFDIMTDMLVSDEVIAYELVKDATPFSEFLLRPEPFSLEGETIIKRVIKKLVEAAEKKANYRLRMKTLIDKLESILNDNNKKRSELANNLPEAAQSSQNIPEASSTDPQTSSKSPEISINDIKTYEAYSKCFNSLTTKDDKQLFNPTFISSLKITKEQQVIDFCNKIIDRVLDAETPIPFFVHTVIKIAQNMPKHLQFRKVLANEILNDLQYDKSLVELMSELYSKDFVLKQSILEMLMKLMDKKTMTVLNMELLHIFVRTCAMKLTKQGDKQLLTQIRNAGKSYKQDDDVALYHAQDLVTSTTSLLSLIESAQKKPKASDSDELTMQRVNSIIDKAFKCPFIAAKAASKVDDKHKQFLIQVCKNYIEQVPKILISAENFENLMDFVAELYIMEVLDNDFISWIIEIFLQHTTDEISCKSLEILLEKCGPAMETSNKSKLDVYFKFFEAVLEENEDSVRSGYFKKFIKLRLHNWKVFIPPANFYEELLMQHKVNNSNIDQLTMHLKYENEEVDKFIQILWKVLLKEAPHPSHVSLCSELSKSCPVFAPKLTAFLTARCNTFSALSNEFYSEDVKHRLGKVVTFVAEIYDKNLLADEVLEMWINMKLIEKVPVEYTTKILRILSNSSRFENCGTEMRNIIDNIETLCREEITAQVSSLVEEFKKLE